MAMELDFEEDLDFEELLGDTYLWVMILIKKQTMLLEGSNLVSALTTGI